MKMGEGTTDRRMFHRGLPACAQEGLSSGRVGAMDHKVQNLEDREELHQGSVNKHCVMIGQWGQAANHL